MNHDSLKRVAECLGYSSAQVEAIVRAVGGNVGTIRAVGDRSGLTQLPTPMAAAASDVKRAMLIKQICSQIKTATKYKWQLPLDKPVDLDELTIGLAGASINQRLAIKDALFHAGLIPA
jgi:hypothetical protein